jgi:hypothetical protein
VTTTNAVRLTTCRLPSFTESICSSPFSRITENRQGQSCNKALGSGVFVLFWILYFWTVPSEFLHGRVLSCTAKISFILVSRIQQMFSSFCSHIFLWRQFASKYKICITPNRSAIKRRAYLVLLAIQIREELIWTSHFQDFTMFTYTSRGFLARFGPGIRLMPCHITDHPKRNGSRKCLRLIPKLRDLMSFVGAAIIKGPASPQARCDESLLLYLCLRMRQNEL